MSDKDPRKNSNRTIAPARPNSATPASKPSKLRLWHWIVIGVVLVVLAAGIFIYIRVNSFVDSSFSGRNEASLLTVAPSPTPRPTRPPQPTKSPATPVPNGPTATPVPAFTPTSAPLPTVTPSLASYPAIIQKIKLGEPMTVLLLGYGGGNHDGAYLTDTILELTYNPAKNAVTIVNIPRDLYVFIPYGGAKVGFWGKINSAFAYVMEAQDSSNLSSRYRFNASDTNSRIDAAVNLTKDVVEGITGTPVDYWATISFDGFRKFVDAIGGVNVNVETAFDDYEYPANDDPQIDASVMHIHFDAGMQHMNGEKAIEYARSRHATQDGSDFGRSKRQMRLISAVKEEVAQPSIMLKAFGVMDALQGNIRTSLSLGDAKALLDYFRGDGASMVSNLLFVPQVLSTDNFLGAGTSQDGAFILFPLAGQSNYTVIQDWLEQGREFPEIRAEGLKVQVQNGSGLQKPLTQFNTDLSQSGLDLIDPVWANNSATTIIYDYSNGKGINTLRAITDLLPDATIKTGKKPYPQAADIVVLLGRDYGQPASMSGSGASGSKLGGTTPQAANLPSSSPYRPTATPYSYNGSER